MTCHHDKITTFRTVDEGKAVMWACNECWEKFVPISQLFAEVAAEREACAALVDANVAVCQNNSMLADVLAGNADAIRARGQA